MAVNSRPFEACVARPRFFLSHPSALFTGPERRERDPENVVVVFLTSPSPSGRFPEGMVSPLLRG